jgi:hypothetical protein
VRRGARRDAGRGRGRGGAATNAGPRVVGSARPRPGPPGRGRHWCADGACRATPPHATRARGAWAPRGSARPRPPHARGLSPQRGRGPRQAPGPLTRRTRSPSHTARACCSGGPGSPWWGLRRRGWAARGSWGRGLGAGATGLRSWRLGNWGRGRRPRLQVPPSPGPRARRASGPAPPTARPKRWPPASNGARRGARARARGAPPGPRGARARARRSLAWPSHPPAGLGAPPVRCRGGGDSPGGSAHAGAAWKNGRGWQSATCSPGAAAVRACSAPGGRLPCVPGVLHRRVRPKAAGPSTGRGL